MKHVHPPTDTPTDEAQVTQDALAPQPATAQRVHEDAASALLRVKKQVATTIEELLALLDTLDGDDDREPEPEHDEDTNDEEPSLGSRNPTIFGDQGSWCAGFTDDTEDEFDGAEPDEDAEASLGSLGGDQTGWARGTTDEREEEHCGRELEHEGDDDPDKEPSLGWAERINQAGGVGGVDDREQGAGAVPPQDCTSIPGADQVHVENTYRRFLDVPAKQRKAIKERQRRDSDVIVR